jgi:hypothetical protein
VPHLGITALRNIADAPGGWLAKPEGSILAMKPGSAFRGFHLGLNIYSHIIVTIIVNLETIRKSTEEVKEKMRTQAGEVICNNLTICVHR